MKIRTLQDPNNDLYLRVNDLLLFLHEVKLQNHGDHVSTDFIIKQIKKVDEDAN